MINETDGVKERCFLWMFQMLTIPWQSEFIKIKSNVFDPIHNITSIVYVPKRREKPGPKNLHAHIWCVDWKAQIWQPCCESETTLPMSLFKINEEEKSSVY